MNVVGDAVGAGIVNHLCLKDLLAKDEEDRLELDAAIAEASRHQLRTLEFQTGLPNESSTTQSGMEAQPTVASGGLKTKQRYGGQRKRLSLSTAMRLQEKISPIVAASLSIDESIEPEKSE